MSSLMSGIGTAATLLLVIELGLDPSLPQPQQADLVDDDGYQETNGQRILEACTAVLD